MNENNPTTEQSNETEEFRLPQKSLTEKIKEAYNYNFQGSLFYLITIVLLCNGLLITLGFLSVQMICNLVYSTPLTTFDISLIEPKTFLLSEILLLILIPIGLFAKCIQETNRIDRNFERFVNNFKKQQLEEQEKINNKIDKGEETQ
jgi:hypothetical protein